MAEHQLTETFSDNNRLNSLLQKSILFHSHSSNQTNLKDDHKLASQAAIVNNSNITNLSSNEQIILNYYILSRNSNDSYGSAYNTVIKKNFYWKVNAISNFIEIKCA